MFDIGFTELLVIGVVALIVIGPERLPKVARTAGHMYGRMQRYVSSVKSDISREMEFDELRRTGQQFKESLESTVSEVQQQATVVDDYLREEASGIRNAVEEIGTSVEEAEPAAEPVKPKRVAANTPQQSLPLDEPDQNPNPTPQAVIETARGSTGGPHA